MRFQHWTRGRGWVFIGKKISGFSPSLWPRPKIFFFSNYSSPLARPRPIAADHFLKPLSRLLDQRKEKDVQESLTKVSSFLWPKPKEMKEMVSRFAPHIYNLLALRLAFKEKEKMNAKCLSARRLPKNQDSDRILSPPGRSLVPGRVSASFIAAWGFFFQDWFLFNLGRPEGREESFVWNRL